MIIGMEIQRGTLLKLFVPIFFETLLLMLSGIVDTLMLSSVPNGVGAVGTANTYIGMFFIALTVVSCGMIAVMTQYVGANKPGVALQARRVALIANGALGLAASLILVFLSRPILVLLGTADDLVQPASQYMRIVAIGSFFDAITLIFSAYLRVFKHTRAPFIATITGNALNIGLNALFLFAFRAGVAGVAWATVIGKVVTLGLAIFLCLRLVKGKTFTERIQWKELLWTMVKIGFPAAIESISYSIAMVFVMRFVNQMDVTGFNATAKSYTTQITNFSYCAAFALAQANSYLVGWRIGAKKFDECYKSTRGVMLIGIGLGVAVELIFALLGKFLIGVFTTDEQLIRIIGIALFIDIGLEVGRASNLILGQALKTSGYSLIPSIFSAIVNVTVAVAGTYLFGLVLRWNVLGAMFALTLDECCRALLLFFLWMSRRWQRTRVVTQEAEPDSPVSA